MVQDDLLEEAAQEIVSPFGGKSGGESDEANQAQLLAGMEARRLQSVCTGYLDCWLLASDWTPERCKKFAAAKNALAIARARMTGPFAPIVAKFQNPRERAMFAPEACRFEASLVLVGELYGVNEQGSSPWEYRVMDEI
jgi:hypothetical protein